MHKANSRHQSKGFTLIEIMLVLALMVFVYAVALPQFSLRTGSEAASKLGKLAEDVRSAYDSAVLAGKPHRMVFELVSGNYWLEIADRREFFLGDVKLDHDPTEEEEKDAADAFEGKFAEYEDLAGEIVTDPETDEEIHPTSPVLQAKDKLRAPLWDKIEGLEWQNRTLGPHLIIQDIQAEHHGSKQDFRELGEEARAFIYFFPSGYSEKAVIHIAYRMNDTEIDEDKAPYTVIINPQTGTATMKSGYEDVDVHNKDAE